MDYSILKKMYLGTIGSTSKTQIYAVPAATTNGPSIVRELTVHNTDANTDVNFTLFINNIAFVNTTIAPKGNLFVGNDWYLVIEPGDKISVQASKGNALNVYMGGSETLK